MDNPCKNCPRQGCGAYHDECTEYLKWKAKEDAKKQAIKESKKFNGRVYISETTFKSRTHGAFGSKKKERR